MSSLAHLHTPPAITPRKGRIVRTGVLVDDGRATVRRVDRVMMYSAVV